MSDRFGLKVKENAGKTKYSTLNLNQTYKGTKVETKTSTGTARHGLQSLGKVGASRRIPPPANLPSLKSENSGNDPTVSLVPSGGGGWGNAKEKTSETPPVSSQAPPSTSTPSQANVPATPQPLLQPQRPSAPSTQQVQPQPQSQNSGQTQTQPFKQQQEGQTRTWSNLTSNGAGGPGRSYSHQQMPYFNREFPVLGGGGNSVERPPQEEKDHTQYGPKPMMRNMHEPPWMDRTGPGPPPLSDYGGGRDRTEMYNGGPGYSYVGGPQCRRPLDYQPGPYPKNYTQGHLPPHHSNGPSAAHGPGPGGRTPHGYPPDYHSRGPVQKPGQHAGSLHVGRPVERGRGEGYGRPAILKPEDIQAMADNEEEEEGGWAGAQEEVDYGAKLDFEDFEDDEKPYSGAIAQQKRDHTAEDMGRKQQSSEGRFGKDEESPHTRQAWTEPPAHPSPYLENRHGPTSSMRHFDSRGSPPSPGWPMPYPQHPPPQKRGGPPVHPTVQGEQGKPVPNAEEPTVNEWQKRREKQQEEMRAAVERARRRREDEELKRQHEQKAAAAAKLKQLEMKKVRRESNKEDDAWAAELDVIEKDSSSKEPLTQLQTQGHEKGIEQSHSVITNQQDDVAARIQPSEYLNRPRNDSESSDGSRSSTSRGTSRPHHHPARDIPPRFQHQQLRQQHQYQQQQQYYHQQQPYQQQHYQQQHQYHVQQLSRSPQYRDFPEGPLTVISHQPVTEPAPVSPSQTPSKTDQPVRRIMKRSDSSSTAGDDVASVKSVESVSSETIRGGQKRSSADPADTVQKVEQPVAIQKTLGGPERSNLDRKEKEAHDDKGVSVFDELEDEKKRQHSDVSKSQSLVFNKEKTQAKEKMQEKKERRVANDKESRTDKEGEMRERRDERRSSKRDARHQEYRHEDDARDFGKRKRDESEDGAWVEDRKVKISGRNESKREYHPELRGRGRVSFPVRGRGRGMGSSSFRGRGRGDYRGSRDSRDYREPRQIRAHESKLSSTSSELQETVEQKQTGEDKEDDVVAGSCAVAASKKKNESIPKNSTEASNKKPVESSSADIEKPCEKPLRGDVEESCKEVRKEEKVTQDDEHKAIVENRDISSKTLDNDGVKSKTRRDSRKSRESYKESNDNTPTQFKGRGGFGKPPQASRDYKKGTDQDRRQTGKRFTDRRHTTQELSRDRNAHYDQRRSIRNYSKDQTNQKLTGREQNRNRERDREGDNRRSFRYDNRDVSNRRPMEDDRRKKGGDRGDDSQHSKQRDDRNQRGGYRPFSRGRFGRTPARGSSRGGRSSYPVGSGRLGTNYRRSRSTDEEISDDDYTDSESSSYTTATSASEERRDEKTSEVEKEGDINRGKEDGLMQEKPRLSSWSARSPIRGKSLPRGGGRGGGGFGRSRREVERPPRFQKQQERERASFGRGVSRGVRQSEGREGGPVRGQGRGRGRSRRELPGKDSFEGPGIPVTEDWDDESVKEAEPSKNDKSIERRESSFRRGFSGQRSSTDRPRRDKNRDTGGTRNAFSRREPFLVERQQAKVEGSKSASGEPQLHLPAARNSLTRDGSAAFHNKKLDKQGLVYNAVDNFSAGDNRVPKKAEQNNKKTDIQQYDLHNFAGVFVIDDMTDDDSDISSTLSGFVEVTSRRTQKENKEKFREEEERRKKDEYNRQRGNQMGSKKTQSVKPPRFSKQHTTSSPPSKSGVISKIASSFVSEVNAGAAPAGGNSNASSTSSTKRNSPVNVERPLSPPPPPPVFNAWDKPLIVTPAKPPSATPMMTSSVPDPLAVGSGKPSTRTAQMKTAISSSAAALIEDKSVDDDYIAMTKEIALLAPPEEPEEPEHPKPQLIQETSQTRVENQDQVPAKPGKMTDNTEKKSQPKPQREKPPRFDRGAKRRPTTSKDETKKEHSEGSKGRKNSRDTSVFQKSPPKGETDDSSKRETVTSETPSQSAATGGQSVMDLSAPRGGQGSDGKTTDTVEDFSTPSDKGTEEKDDVKQESEEHEAKDDSETESSRKDSEPDLNVDSAERNDQTGDLFSTRTLTADIHGRSGPDRPDREPSPVSPDFVKMTKNLEVSRKLWEEPELSIPIPSTWEETLCTSANVSTSVVGMSVVESNNDPQVPVSKSQVELEAASNKTDSKPVDNTNFAKKTGEQQNVCKVKPQQQQPVKPQQTLASGPQVVDEIRQPEMNAVPPSQPLLTQDHLSQQQSIPPRLAFSFPFVDMQHRPQFLQQQLQQSNQVAHAFPLTHVQPPVNQGRSSSSPLSQTPQDIYPSYLPSTVYSTGNFPGSQSFVPIALLSNTTTQSFATSTSRTQTTSLMGIQAQQPKTGTGSVFAPGVTHTGAQHMYMSFDPQTLSGGRPLFNQPQPSQRHLLGAQAGIMGDHIPRQGGFASAQQTHQPFQQNYPFQQKLSTFEVAQDISVQKTPNQGTADLIRQSELAKHINAKPFEPPKRSTPSSVPTSNAEIAALVSSAFVRNPNLIPLRPSPPAMAASSQSPPVTNSLISGRPMSMSPVDPTVPFPGAVGTFPKHTAVGQYHLQQQPRTVQPQRFTPFQQQPVSLQHTLQISPQGGQQQQGVNQLSGGTAAILSNQAVVAATLPRQIIRTTGLGSVSMTGAQPTAPGAQRFPRPIQRPMPASLIHSIPHMQAPQGPRAQTVPVQMAPMKQQIMSARPQIPAPPPPPPQQDPATAAFKSEEHDKMVEQTKMFFAQHEQQQQQRTPHQSAQSGNQLPKVAPAGTNTQGSKLTGNVEVASENSKPLEKKEETKPHVIELNPRMRKPTLEQAAKAIKITKTESKPEDSSKDRTSKQDGKGNGNKRSGPVPITPLPQQRPLPSRNRPNPNRSRGPPRVPGAMPSSKAKISVRPEKEANSIAIDQPVETQSPKNADQAKVSNAQSVQPLSISK